MQRCLDIVRKLHTEPTMTGDLDNGGQATPSRQSSSPSPSSLPSSSPSLLCRRIDLFLDFDSPSCRTVEVERSSTALHVLQTFFSENRCGNCANWAVFEHRRPAGFRRIVEDHEVLSDIQTQWCLQPDGVYNRFVVKQDYCKYEVFRNPKQFFPEGMLNLPSEKYEMLAGEHSAAQNAFLRNLILSTNWLPEVEGSLCLREKKIWKKQYLILRPSGLYTSAKHASRDPRHLALICSLEGLNIYQVEGGKKTLGAPTESVICLKGLLDDTVFEGYFACEDEEMLRNWSVALRLQKYGETLKENYLSAVQTDQMLYTTKNIKELAIQDKSKARVAMDFSGDCGRIVNSQQEAVDALVTEAQGWKKRRTERSIDSPSSPGDSLPLHLSQTWFHGGVSREDATRLLTSQGLVDGVFLVRKSRSEPGSYVLSMSQSGKVRHHRVARVKMSESQTVLSLDDGKTKFSDLLQLIEFYYLNVGSLGCKLTHSVKKQKQNQ